MSMRLALWLPFKWAQSYACSGVHALRPGGLEATVRALVAHAPVPTAAVSDRTARRIAWRVPAPVPSSAWGRTGCARPRRAKEVSFPKFDMNHMVLSPAASPCPRGRRSSALAPVRLPGGGQQPASCFWASLRGAGKVSVRTEEHDANEATTGPWKAVIS